MKILTWNCNGAFRRKYAALSQFDADILVIQECEDPRQTTDAQYRQFGSNCLWTGPTKNKGIGVFARAGIALEPVPLELGTLELFLPCTIDSRIRLLATWTRHANSPNFAYIGQLWKFLNTNRQFLTSPLSMLIGDLNSNKRWDEWDRWWNHTDVVRDLSNIGLTSAYHQFFKEEQGAETRPTLFLQRKLEKPYHIDYGFFEKNWQVDHVTVGDAANWLSISDHMPMFFEISPKNQ